MSEGLGETPKRQKSPPQGLQITRGSRAAGWKFPLDRFELTLAVKAMLIQAGRGRASLEIALLDDFEMAQVHKEFLDCDSPTNVLAFPSASPKELGWMAVSSDTLLRECFLYGQPPALYALRLLSHGIAHLAGYDHGPEMDEFADKLYTKAENTLSRHKAL